VDLADGPGDDADAELPRQGLVARQVGCRLGAGRDEVWVVRAPRG
jgi:hypothetical protein